VDIYGQCEHLGVMTFDDGDKYEGGFYQGTMSGPGIYYGDGYMFMGEWEDNQKSGCGVAAYMNGVVEYGEWKYDQYLGQYTRKCPLDKSIASMESSIDSAARAKMFERKPNSEVYLRIVEGKTDYLKHHDPIVYKKGTEWTMPGPAAELYTPPTEEEMGPEVAGAVRTANYLWERIWTYYNVKCSEERRTIAPQARKKKEAMALSEMRTEENVEDEYADVYNEDGSRRGRMKKPKQQNKNKNSGSKRGKTASLTVSMMTALQQNAFRGWRRQLRRPIAFAQRVKSEAQAAVNRAMPSLERK
jgi:hypothetical protein